MAGGYTGKMLFVDLSSRKVEEQSLDDNFCRKFIGGYGIGASILYRNQKGGVDPLGPDNILGFVTGPLTGTNRCWGSRYTVVAKSPLTGVWGDANSGGEFGPLLKFAGCDAVFFKGISEKPVYLLCNNGTFEIKDAAHLWGKDTHETAEILKAQLGKKFGIATIGPAGEKRSLIAAVMSERFRAAARGGLGAVMGSKNLKAVVAIGNGTVPVADKDALGSVTKEYLSYIKTNPIGINWKKYGTCVITTPLLLVGDVPVKNWAGAGPLDYPNSDRISGDSVIAHEYVKHGCWRCPNPCGGLMKPGSQFKYPKGVYKPEYESVAALGPLCMNENLESMILANDICNQYGVDTMSAGAIIAFAMECYENGVITKEDTDGIDLKWGNPEALIDVLYKIVKREGIGEVLADGVKVAAQKIGEKAEKYALHVHGQEPAFHDPRFSVSFASAYAFDAHPGRHTQGGLGAPLENMQGLKLPEVALTRDFAPGRGVYEALMRNMQHTMNSTGMCLFGYWIMPREAIVDLMSCVTGWKLSMEELVTTGERISAMRQVFTLREGVKPAVDFKLPGRIIGDPPLSQGPTAGRTVNVKELSDDYYKSMGWDPEIGVPTVSRLQELGLDDVASTVAAEVKRI